MLHFEHRIGPTNTPTTKQLSHLLFSLFSLSALLRGLRGSGRRTIRNRFYTLRVRLASTCVVLEVEVPASDVRQLVHERGHRGCREGDLRLILVGGVLIATDFAPLSDDGSRLSRRSSHESAPVPLLETHVETAVRLVLDERHG